MSEKGNTESKWRLEYGSAINERVQDTMKGDRDTLPNWHDIGRMFISTPQSITTWKIGEKVTAQRTAFGEIDARFC